MCIDAASRVVSIEQGGTIAKVQGRGGVRPVSLVILALDGEQVSVGDWLLVNSGIAVRVLDEAQAAGINEVYERAEVQSR